MDAGRKFYLTLLGMLLVAGLSMFVTTPSVGTAISAISAMVLTFCGANAAVSMAYAKTESSAESREISERRDPVVGFEPTP